MNQSTDSPRSPPSTRSRWRYSLRALIAMTAFAGVACGILVHRSRINGAVRRLESVGATVEYHPSTFPFWHRLTGNFFANARTVEMKAFYLDDEQLKPLSQLTLLEKLHLCSGTHVTVARLASLPQLEELSLASVPRSYKIDGRAIPELLKLRGVKRLDISDTDIGGSELRQLAGMKCLEELTFRANFEHPMNSEDIQFVASLPKASAKSQLYLSNIDDESLLRLCSIDLAQNKSFHIHNSRLTQPSIEVLNQQPSSYISFRNCTLDSDAIAPLDWMRDENGLTCVEFQGCGLSLEDLAQHVTPLIHQMNFNWSSRFNQLSVDLYDQSTLHCVRLTGFTSEDVTTEALTRLENLKRVYVGRALAPNIFRWMIETQPHLALDIHFQGELQPLWDAVAKTPSLTELEIHADDAPSVLGKPTFTDHHRLKKLIVSLNDMFIHPHMLDEIAKLSELEELGLYHCQDPGPEIARLEPLQRLKTISISPKVTRPDTLDAMMSIGFTINNRHPWIWNRAQAE